MGLRVFVPVLALAFIVLFGFDPVVISAGVALLFLYFLFRTFVR